ncbi:MAG TPA: hypothetical protein VNR64_05825 [Vicinamibacterales bacterium]|nr:hypothetical protein [Vicinamibacterales bacterium]
MRVQQPDGLAGRIFERTRYRLAMVVPCRRQLRLPAKSEQTRECACVLGVNRLAPLKSAAHQRRCPCHQVFDRHDEEATGLVVQRRRARQRIYERSKEVDSNGGRFVNELQQRLTFNRIRVDMVEKERRGDRFGNRVESMHDEIDVVQVAPFDKTTVRAEPSSDCQPTGQRAWNAMGQYGVNSCGRSMRIVVVQETFEHASWYRAHAGRHGWNCHRRRHSVHVHAGDEIFTVARARRRHVSFVTHLVCTRL